MGVWEEEEEEEGEEGEEGVGHQRILEESWKNPPETCSCNCGGNLPVLIEMRKSAQESSQASSERIKGGGGGRRRSTEAKSEGRNPEQIELIMLMSGGIDHVLVQHGATAVRK